MFFEEDALYSSPLNQDEEETGEATEEAPGEEGGLEESPDEDEDYEDEDYEEYEGG